MARARSELEPGLLRTFIGDGRPLLYVTAVSLLFSGGFALFLSAERQFLPQDLAALDMTPAQLCALAGCRVVDFMIHDRVAWGGTLIAVGAIYLWLISYPLSEGEGWAWWALTLSGAVGFASFLGYIGSGYLDTWHGVGTALLMPCFVVGIVRSHAMVVGDQSVAALLRPAVPIRVDSRLGLARSVMLVAAAGMTVGGLVILWVGATRVFVPQDLTFMGSTKLALDAVNPKLVPLMAHDRIGFGGGVATTGLLATICVWRPEPTPNLWKILAVSWFAASACAVGIHLVVGYDDVVHLAPAVVGAVTFLGGWLFGAPAVLHRDPA